jgi:hypothetical protein
LCSPVFGAAFLLQLLGKKEKFMCAKLLDSIGFVSGFDPEIAAMMGRELDR